MIEYDWWTEIETMQVKCIKGALSGNIQSTRATNEYKALIQAFQKYINAVGTQEGKTTTGLLELKIEVDTRDK